VREGGLLFGGDSLGDTRLPDQPDRREHRPEDEEVAQLPAQAGHAHLAAGVPDRAARGARDQDQHPRPEPLDLAGGEAARVRPALAYGITRAGCCDAACTRGGKSASDEDDGVQPCSGGGPWQAVPCASVCCELCASVCCELCASVCCELSCEL